MKERGAHQKLATVMLVAAMIVSTVVAVQVLEAGGYADTQPQEVERTGIFDIYPEDAEVLAARARVVALQRGADVDRFRGNLLSEYHLAVSIRYAAMNPRERLQDLSFHEVFNLMAIQTTSIHPDSETGLFDVFISPQYYGNEAAMAELLENIYRFANIPAERVRLDSFTPDPDWTGELKADPNWMDGWGVDNEEPTPLPGDYDDSIPGQVPSYNYYPEYDEE